MEEKIETLPYLLGITCVYLVSFSGKTSDRLACVKLKKIFKFFYRNGLIFNVQMSGVYFVVAGPDVLPEAQLAPIFEAVMANGKLTINSVPIKRGTKIPVRFPFPPLKIVGHWGGKRWRSVGGLEVYSENGKSRLHPQPLSQPQEETACHYLQSWDR